MGRLEKRLSDNAAQVASSMEVAKLPRDSAGFRGSTTAALSTALKRLKEDKQHFKEVLLSLQPIAFE
jgi:hypothetical protein